MAKGPMNQHKEMAEGKSVNQSSGKPSTGFKKGGAVKKGGKGKKGPGC